MILEACWTGRSRSEVVYWWSWNKLAAGVLNEEDKVLPNGRRAEDNPDGNTHDVRWRPVPVRPRTPADRSAHASATRISEPQSLRVPSYRSSEDGPTRLSFSPELACSNRGIFFAR